MRDGGGLQGIAGDAGNGMGGGGWPSTAGDHGGRPGTIRVMSHDFNPALTEGPSARTIVPHSPSCPHPPGHSPS